MGNGMTCATTQKTEVAQGGANGRVAGAPPPPPPTGAVGGGGALHRSVGVVAQIGKQFSWEQCSHQEETRTKVEYSLTVILAHSKLMGRAFTHDAVRSSCKLSNCFALFSSARSGSRPRRNARMTLRQNLPQHIAIGETIRNVSMTLHQTFPRFRGMNAIKANQDSNALLTKISASVADMKAAQAKDIAAIGKDVDTLNTKMAAFKMNGGGFDPAQSSGFGEEGTALAEFGRTGAHFNASLSSDDLSKGGAVVMPVVSKEIKIRQFDQSALARLARRVTIENGDSFEEPWDLGDVGTEWVGEKESRPKTETPDFHLLNVPLHELYCLQAITQRLLDDSSYPLGEWLGGRIADKHGRSSGSAFMIGDGVKKPRGLTTYPLSSAGDATRPWVTMQALYTGVDGGLPTASTSASPADILIDTVYALKAQFRRNAVWIMNSKTAGIVRKLKDADGRFLWTDSIAKGQPPLLLGYPVEVDEFAPDIATDTAAIWFGDISEAYVIVDRPGIRLLRDPFTDKPNVLFYAYSRVGGGLQNSEAVKAVVFGSDPSA